MTAYTHRRLRALLTARPGDPAGQLSAGRHRALSQSMLLVRAFYVCAFFIQLQLYPNWNYWLNLKDLRLVWPVGWLAWVGTRGGVAIVIPLGIGSALLAAAWPTIVWFRAAAALGMCLFAAFFNSFGNINHGLHTWVWVSFIVVFLPNGTTDSIARSIGRTQRYLRVVWTAQAAVLAFYSMSGCFKLAAGVFQIVQGQANTFGPDALARHTAYRLLEGSSSSNVFLGPWVIAHPYIGWPFYLLAVYLETFSLLVAFRPAVHRIWGFALICFHLGIYLAMTIMFSWEMLMVGLLLVCSPFAPPRMSWRAVARQLPIVGDVVGWKQATGKTAPDPV